MRRHESDSHKFDRHSNALIFHILTPASLFPTLSSRSYETDIKSSENPFCMCARKHFLHLFIYAKK